MRGVRDYATITAAYWAFTITDGALRMLVLLHLHELGHTPIEIVSLFLVYEAIGVLTNFGGGWLGARSGLKTTLFLGLGLQIVACALLAFAAHELGLMVLLATQAFAGVAKDLTKMSAKSYIKLVVPEGDRRGLMKWVSLLTGSKNALKGVGFFVGGVLLTVSGFRGACLAMASWLLVALLAAMAVLPRAAGKAKAPVGLRSLFTQDRRLRWLSAARLFLFGSRDTWFALALPVFLSTELSWSFHAVGGFLALWVIGYGLVQAAAPAWVRGKNGSPPTGARLGRWTLALLIPLALIPICLRIGVPPSPTVIVGLAVFGLVFAANSAIHSFLVVAYADPDKVSIDVGFYYMANAAGRFVGTLLSGVVFQTAGSGRVGLEACLGASIVLVAVSAALCVPLRAAEEEADHAMAGGLET